MRCTPVEIIEHEQEIEAHRGPLRPAQRQGKPSDQRIAETSRIEAPAKFSEDFEEVHHV
jgi:hypothetical protein